MDDWNDWYDWLIIWCGTGHCWNFPRCCSFSPERLYMQGKIGCIFGKWFSPETPENREGVGWVDGGVLGFESGGRGWWGGWGSHVIYRTPLWMKKG